MQRADEKLIPSVAKDVKEAFNATLSDIGYLSFIRNIVQGLASPLAGLLVISYDRPTVFAVGCLCWVLSTVAVGASRFFTQVLFRLHMVLRSDIGLNFFFLLHYELMPEVHINHSVKNILSITKTLFQSPFGFGFEKMMSLVTNQF